MVVQFLESMTARGLSGATIKRRRLTLSMFSRQHPLDSATADDIERWLLAFDEPATRRAYLGDLRAFYRWALRRSVLATDPTLVLDTPKVPDGTPRPLSRRDLMRAINAASDRVRRRVLLAAYAGLRVSEIAALHADDIDLEHGTLTVRNGKGGKDRVVPLAPVLADELAGTTGRVCDCRTADGVSSSITALFERLEINRRPHDLRATFATEVAATSDLMLASRLLGHKSIQTTMTYVAVRPPGAEAVAGLYAA